MRRLELGHINIKDIQFGPESKIEDGVLYVDEEAVKANEGASILSKIKPSDYVITLEIEGKGLSSV